MDIRPIDNVVQFGAPLENRGAIQSEFSAAAAPVTAAPVHVAAAVQQPAPTPDSPEVAQALKEINRSFQGQALSVEFSIDETDRAIVKVVDQETQEVLRQMPTREALEIAKALDKMQGMLIRQKA